MATENEEPLSRATNATTKRIKIRLDEIKIDTERYCHRDNNALTDESLKSLMDSLILEDLQNPVEIYRDEDGNAILLKGHRRVTACRLLADKNEPGFTRDREVDAIEVTNATPADLTVRSILDNEVRQDLTRVGRIRVAKKLSDARVPDERAARAMGVSVKTYERDLTIAKHGWMFQHVMDNSIGPTHAYVLLDTAKKEGRLAEMKEDLDAWIAKKKQEIRDEEKRRKARGEDEMKPNEKQVKNELPNHLVEHWLDLIKEKKRFDEDAEWDFAARIKPKEKKPRTSPITCR